MAFFPKPAAGSWTENYPELGTGAVDFADSTDPEFCAAEREAIFMRTWLNVGRVERVPKAGNYFTKEMAVAETSLVIVRGQDGKVRAFHNVYRHRGNKLVWNEAPGEETSGTCRQFVCKYHAWRYDLTGNLSFVQQEGEFFDLDKFRLRAQGGRLRRVGRVHLRQLRPAGTAEGIPRRFGKGSLKAARSTR